jgi:hypothetical protein
MGWTNPFVLTMIGVGLACLILFVAVERRVKQPMFELHLFRIRPFTAGNTAGLLSSIGRGGLMFMLIISAHDPSPPAACCSPRPRSQG